MSQVYPKYHIGPIYNIEKPLSDYFKLPTEEEKSQIELQIKSAQIKAQHDKFLREREHKERRLLYAIAEKLGIDIDSV